MSGKLIRLTFGFNTDDEKGKIAYDFIRSFKRKQSDFLVALLFWYSTHMDEYKLAFLPESNQIIDAKETADLFSSFGIPKEENERLLRNYGDEQLSQIIKFLKEMKNIKDNSVPELNAKNENEVHDSVNTPVEMKEETSISDEENKKMKPSEPEPVSQNNEDEDDEDRWMLNMAGFPTKM